MKSRTRDLTNGPIGRGLFWFFVPLLISNLLQQLYTTVDSVIVGQFLGKTGLAAIDAVSSLIRLPTNFFVGISAGAAILISKYYGARKNRQLSETVHSAVAFAILGGGGLAAAGALFAPYFVGMVSVPAEIAHLSNAYTMICFSGFLFMLLFNVGAGILRAAGDAMTPLRALAVSGLCNVLLDLLLIAVLKMGVEGAAAATVASQLISAVLVFVPLTKTADVHRVEWKNVRFKKEHIIAQIRLGVPLGLQNSLMPIANVMVQASINNTGADFISAWSLYKTLNLLIWLSADTLSAAISTFVAQNHGAGRYERISRGVLIGLGMTVAVSAFFSAVNYFFGGQLAQLLINSDGWSVLPILEEVLRQNLPFYIAYAVGEVFSAAIRGCGDTLRPMLISIVFICGFRILWIIFAVPLSPTLSTIVLSFPISWILNAVAMTMFYLWRRRGGGMQYDY